MALASSLPVVPPVAAWSASDCVYAGGMDVAGDAVPQGILADRTGGEPKRRASITVSIDSELAAEHYTISVKRDHVKVVVADVLAAHWAADTLAQLANAGPLPCGELRDGPVLPVRWAHVQLPGDHTDGSSLFDRQRASVPEVAHFEGAADYLPLLERFVDNALASRMNGVVVDLNRMWRFDSHPELARPEAASLSALEPLADRLRQAGAELVPLLHLFSHQEHLLAPAYPELLLLPMGSALSHYDTRGPRFHAPLADPRLPAVQAIVSDLIDEVCTRFKPRVLHIGHDEAGGLAAVPRDEDTLPSTLLAMSVRHARDRAAQHGVAVAMWADMLLPAHRVPGAAHGSEPGANTWRAVEDIPDDVILVDWQYWPSAAPWPRKGPLDDVPSLRFLANTGHPVLGASLGRPTVAWPPRPRLRGNAEQSARLARTLASLPPQRIGPGLLTTHWLFTPGRLDPWTDTDVAGSLWLGGLHGWTGGRWLAPGVAADSPIDPGI